MVNWIQTKLKDGYKSLGKERLPQLINSPSKTLSRVETLIIQGSSCLSKYPSMDELTKNNSLIKTLLYLKICSQSTCR